MSKMQLHVDNIFKHNFGFAFDLWHIFGQMSVYFFFNFMTHKPCGKMFYCSPLFHLRAVMKSLCFSPHLFVLEWAAQDKAKLLLLEH